MTYEVRLAEEARAYMRALDEQSRRIATDNLEKIADDPHPRPGSGTGETERLTVRGETLYRLHIGRTHTAFYVSIDAEQEVRIVDVMSIDDAHDRYGV